MVYNFRDVSNKCGIVDNYLNKTPKFLVQRAVVTPERGSMSFSFANPFNKTLRIRKNDIIANYLNVERRKFN